MVFLEFITFLCLSSGFLSAVVTRALSPFLWSLNPAVIHSLNPTEVIVPEIDLYLYVVFVALFFIFFVLLGFLFKRAKQFVRVVSWTELLYLLFYPTIQLTSIGFSVLPILGLAAVVQLSHKYIDKYFPYIVSAVLIKYVLPAIMQFDAGADPGNYRHYVPVIAVGIFVAIVYRIMRRFIRPWMIWLVVFGAISVSILRLMLIYEDGWDMFFTIIPAYHMAHGGVPFVNMISQYGFGYIFPWVLWILAFPSMPLSYETGLISTAIFLIMYFGVLAIVLGKIMRRSVVAATTLAATYFYTILIRFEGFPGYKVALVSHPSFTPLRFGIFLLPLVFLVLYIRRKQERYFSLFLLTGVLGILFSFEIGIGLVAAALAIGIARIVQGKNKSYTVWNLMTQVAAAVSMGALGVCAYAVVMTGALPDIRTYLMFTGMFSSGFYMIPVGDAIAFIVPMVVSVAAILAGTYRYIRFQNLESLVFIFLGVIQLAALPYYMGRSVAPTLFGISMPFLILCGMAVDAIPNMKKNIVILTGGLLCAGVLFLGAGRALVSMAPDVLNVVSISTSSVAFMQKSWSTWGTKGLPEYAFLQNSLPPGCPLVSMDSAEYELMPALGVAPAFQYSFIRGYIVSKEQIASLAPNRPFCLFIHQADYDTYDARFYFVYRAIWEKFKSQATLIQEDAVQGFRLYSIN